MNYRGTRGLRETGNQATAQVQKRDAGGLHKLGEPDLGIYRSGGEGLWKGLQSFTMTVEWAVSKL